MSTICRRCYKIIPSAKKQLHILDSLSFCHSQIYRKLSSSFRSFRLAPLNRSIYSRRNWSNTSVEQHTTIDDDEHRKFKRMATQWWDERGEFLALHSLNKIRIPFIRDALVDSVEAANSSLPLKDRYILDVGSGGGLVAEPLARLGASVIGVDMVEENTKIAMTHLMEDSRILDRVKYIHGAVEDLVATEEGNFDAVIASEVVEHVYDVDTFISCCVKLLKPGGSLFITTLNKTYLSYGLAVVGAEWLANVVPPGTHDWNKFIAPDELQHCLEGYNMSVKFIHGICYNPVINKWSWISNTDVNYAMHAVKCVDPSD